MSWESQMRFTDDEWIDPKIAAALAEPRVRDVVSRTLAGLSYDAQEKALDVVRDVALGKVSLDEFSEALIERARVEDEKAYEIDGELYAEVWSAFEEDLEKQVAVYAELHPEAALPPSESAADSIEALADGIVAKSRLFGDDQMMLKRLRSLIVSHLKDIRDEAETRAMLEKPPKTGGLGLAPTVAASVLLFAAESRPELAKRNESLGRLRAEAEQARAAAEAMRKEKIAALRAGTLTISVPKPVVEEVPVAVSVGASVDAKGESDEDDADIAKIKAVLAARDAVAESAPASVPPVSPLDAAVDETLVALGGTFASEDLKNRMRMLTSLYFRDLRDHLETTSKLTMPVASGGMGMTDEDAVTVMALLKARNGAYHAASLEKVKEGKQQFVAEKHANTLAREDAAVKHETDSLNKVFSSVTGTRMEAPPAAPSAPRAIPVTAIGRTGEQAVVTARPPEVRPVTIPVPLPPPPPAPVVFEKPATATPAPVPTPAPLPAPAPVPADPTIIAPVTHMQLAPNPPAPTKPSMADVSGAPRLTGPVEELKALTLKDVRRLSRDPREALLKLRDKIDLLGEQSFDMKTKGIKAWQDSEVNGMYLQLLRASLEGIPVMEVIAAKEAKGEQTLNKAEFDAIMAFNRELRFG